MKYVVLIGDRQHTILANKVVKTLDMVTFMYGDGEIVAEFKRNKIDGIIYSRAFDDVI